MRCALNGFGLVCVCLTLLACGEAAEDSVTPMSPAVMEEELSQEDWLALEETADSDVPPAAVEQAAPVAAPTFEPVVGAGAVPTFKGFEKPRYQKFDRVIAELTERLNADPVGHLGVTPEQAAGMTALDPALVKSWMIQESGGGLERDLAAWNTDPTRMNIPANWGPEKAELGLRKPSALNSGDLYTNLWASIRYLARKGFSRSGKAPKPDATFDGWRVALERYNGRRKASSNGRSHAANYADWILERARKPHEHFKVQLPK